MQKIALNDLDIHAEQAELLAWQGRQALRLENGLALVPERTLEDASLSVMIGVEGPAYPGVAFRLADVLNFELAYAVPHASGLWDALQYDPVFHGSNTWQIFYGAGYQTAVQVPVGRWFQFKVAFCGQQAQISVDGQAALVVSQLAHQNTSGLFGLWTFRPAFYCDLQVSPAEDLSLPKETEPLPSGDQIKRWFLDGYGVVTCEPNGVLNLNRYLPTSLEKVRLLRRFELLEPREITLDFGFSDVLSLMIDSEVVFTGENKFSGFDDRSARGYAEMGSHSTKQVLPAGSHTLTAELHVKEDFGWGLVMAVHADGLHWLPAESG